MFGSGYDDSECFTNQKFVEIDNEFYPRQNKNDKFVDVALGKKFIVLCTEGGKVYGSSYYLYRYIREAARKNE